MLDLAPRTKHPRTHVLAAALVAPFVVARLFATVATGTLVTPCL